MLEYFFIIKLYSTSKLEPRCYELCLNTSYRKGTLYTDLNGPYVWIFSRIRRVTFCPIVLHAYVVVVCRRVFAFDKDGQRLASMRKLTQCVGASGAIQLSHMDFLKVDPTSPQYSRVTHAIVDPSCSGSGESAFTLTVISLLFR